MYTLAIDPGAKPGFAEFYGPTLIGVSRTRPNPTLQGGLTIEVPTSRGGNTRATGDDLIKLALRAGEEIGFFRSRGFTVQTVTPNEWKGSVPKRIHHPRIKACLGADELRLTIGIGPDEWDAVGLGLWYLGRLEGPR